MSNNDESSGNTECKAILILSASHHLVSNVGFTVDPTDVSGTLKTLQQTLQTRSWDGVIVGWRMRGHVEFTVLFEKMVAMIVKLAILQPELKIMFCAGPDDLVETTIRNFPV
ncbi:hypothetical protein V1506DRAFT_547943 [Lipomyces tetrasporus]